MAGFSLRPKAISDLESIWEYTVETCGEEQAERYVRLINECFRQITDNPGLGRSCDAIREGYRKRSVGRHVIYYRTTDECIEVVRILHDRMDIDRHL
ncbi:MAG: type II toxin-antitoxin system RelE/ParE family toxin [Verrucomicrobiaceae bacterium]|nr:type II toxin-antitoxin system RelE/ParE family toxin [Verrucomicrobiaceae bacterium]NCF90019.1 type II toxin-antitoxin system RelE/ParE family toxin [Verrucomicrobiaceae bacterium]